MGQYQSKRQEEKLRLERERERQNRIEYGLSLVARDFSQYKDGGFYVNGKFVAR